MVGIHLDRTLRSIKLDANQSITNCAEIFIGTSLLNCGLPEVDHVVGRLHRVIGDTIIAILSQEGVVESVGSFGAQGHEVIPGRVSAAHILGANLANFLFSDGEGHDRVLLRINASSLELLEQSNVGVSVQSIDDDASIWKCLFDLGDDRGNLSISKGNVVLTNGLTAQALDLLFNDGVGRPWIDVVRAD